MPSLSFLKGIERKWRCFGVTSRRGQVIGRIINENLSGIETERSLPILLSSYRINNQIVVKYFLNVKDSKFEIPTRKNKIKKMVISQTFPNDAILLTFHIVDVAINSYCHMKIILWPMAHFLFFILIILNIFFYGNVNFLI